MFILFFFSEKCMARAYVFVFLSFNPIRTVDVTLPFNLIRTVGVTFTVYRPYHTRNA
uniref:Uncharacterized protein n=1 Tax=Oryza brachyantha TaxID=4533 RepID=J3NAB2_ORYBR